MRFSSLHIDENRQKKRQISSKTLQEVQMLSIVTLICQVSISQLSELQSVSQMSQISKIFFAIVSLCQVMSSHHSDLMSQRSQVYRIAL